MTQQRFSGGFGGPGGFGESPRIRMGPPLTPVIKYFMIACGAAFIIQKLFPSGPDLGPFMKMSYLEMDLGLVPEKLFSGYIWQLFTFNFLHGGVMHLALNMLMLWMFGGELELKLGRRRFIILMVISGAGAGLCQSLVSMSSVIPIIGASGIVFGLLLVYGITWPNRTVLVMFLIPMKEKWMVLIFGAIEFFYSLQGSQIGIAHIAHLGGMLFAYLFVRYDKLYMNLRKAYYERKLKRYRDKFKVYPGGKDDRQGPTIH